MAISFVGASIIWNFIYEYRPAGQPQIGLLNCYCNGFRGYTASLAAMGCYRALEQSVPDRDCYLVASWLFHGSVFGSVERHS